MSVSRKPFEDQDDFDFVASIFATNSDPERGPHIARRLLSNPNGMAGILLTPEEKLRKWNILSAEDIDRLRLCREFLLRTLRARFQRVPCTDYQLDLETYMIASFCDARTAQIRILYLDAKHHLIADELSQTGSLDSVTFYPREVARRCLELDAHGLIAAYHRPRGFPDSLVAIDHALAELRDALAVFNIDVIDVLICHDNECRRLDTLRQSINATAVA